MIKEETTPIYVDLLKESEKYCEQNNLTTASDLLAVVHGPVQKITDETFRETLLSMMKGAAYYSTQHDKASDETMHYVLCYNANHADSCLVMSMCEQGEFVISYYISAHQFNEFFANVPSKKIKNFKCLEKNN